MDKLRKLINDDELFNNAINMSNKPKVKPSTVYGKNNYIYSLPHIELHKGLDLINKSLKKPSNNSFIFLDNKKNSKIIQELNKLLEDDPENNILVALIILQTEKEKNIKFIPTNFD
jgi:hypothetical protein